MFETVAAVIEQHRLLPAEGRVIVAVSGGADSLCLLHILQRLCGSQRRYPTIVLHVAHLNHQLRGEDSDADAHAMEQIAHSWNLPITVGSINVPALARHEQYSIEEAARVARYRFLREVAQGQPIVVAQHKDDQVETLLLHWLRGGGLASMTGMQFRQQDIIRPLLSITHAETVAYCEKHHIIPLEDASNNDPHYLRNRIRHELIPLLSSMNPGIRETLLRNAEVMQEDFAWIEEQVEGCWLSIVHSETTERYQLRVEPLRELPTSIQRHLLRRVTARLNGGQSPLELRHYHLIEDLMQRAGGEMLTLHLPEKISVFRTRDLLAFERQHGIVPGYEHNRDQWLFTGAEAVLPLPGHVAIPGTSWLARAEIVPEELIRLVQPALACGDWEQVCKLLPVMPHAVYVDADSLRGEQASSVMTILHVRTRRKGDRIQPLGMVHEKKVQDVLVDKRIPRNERDQIPLFFTDAHCAWLADVHLDERVRLTHQTRKIVRLSISELI